MKSPIFIKIQKSCLNRLSRTIKEHNLIFKNPLIITDKNVLDIAAKKIIKQFKKHSLYLAKTNTFQETKKIINKAQKNSNDLIIAIGGGKILDLGKYAGTEAKLRFINVPTAPSHDGIASQVAIIKNKKGITESLGVNQPLGILADLNILKNAPKKMIAAGIADLLSNFSALQDWKLANKDRGEDINKRAYNLADKGAKLIYDNYKDKPKIDTQSDKLLELLVNGLISGGQAMSIAGSSRPCSGAEHEIAHAIEALHPDKFMHGEEVALGTIIANRIRSQENKTLIKIFKHLNLPIKYQDLGLNKPQIIQVIQLAPKTRPGRYTILEKKKLSKKQIEKLL